MFLSDDSRLTNFIIINYYLQLQEKFFKLNIEANKSYLILSDDEMLCKDYSENVVRWQRENYLPSSGPYLNSAEDNFIETIDIYVCIRRNYNLS